MGNRRLKHFFWPVFCLLFLSGCSTLPSFGPSSNSIVNAADAEILEVEQEEVPPTNFRLIDISQTTLPKAHFQHPHYFSAKLLEQTFLQVNQRVIPADVISIRVWESANDGLFASSGRRETNFTLSVSNSGRIDVPYAGSIEVADRSVHQIREILLERYKGKAIDPEINVEIRNTSSRGVSILGAVARPGRINIPSQGIRLLDLIALAGGIPYPIWETDLTLSRGDFSETLSIDAVLKHPENNIVVLPNDTIQIKHVPRKFSVYGAIARPGNFILNTPDPRLSDLLAESGGLIDMNAEASSVFIFRPDEETSESYIINATAYRLNFSRPDAFILASQFAVADTDIVYVATADASEFRKFITTLLSPLLKSANSIKDLSE